MNATRGGLTGINIPDWMFKAILAILGFMLVYMLNQKTDEIGTLNAKLDLIIQQNSDVQGELKLVKSKLADFEDKFGDHESRIRELELKDARRDNK